VACRTDVKRGRKKKREIMATLLANDCSLERRGITAANYSSTAATFLGLEIEFEDERELTRNLGGARVMGRGQGRARAGK